MKSKHLLLLTSLATLTFALPSQAIGQRTFKSADKTKSFEATLTDCDAQKNTVTVVFASGKQTSFLVSVLSKEDQDYILANQDLLVIAKSVRLKFEEVKVKGGGEGVATGYSIEVYNRGKRAVEDVTLKYTLYYSQGDLTKGGTIDKTKTGTLTTGKMFDADTMTVETARVDIVRKIKPASGGGWCGPNVPGGRRVDHMVGVVVDIVVGDEIVRTESNSKNLLNKVLKERSNIASR